MTITETSSALKLGQPVSLMSEGERRLAALEQAASRVALGVVDLAEGQEAGTVTGLALTFTPTVADLELVIPEGGDALGVVRVGELTADGFAWRLTNGVPPGPGYKFNFRLT